MIYGQSYTRAYIYIYSKLKKRALGNVNQNKEISNAKTYKLTNISSLSNNNNNNNFPTNNFIHDSAFHPSPAHNPIGKIKRSTTVIQKRLASRKTPPRSPLTKTRTDWLMENTRGTRRGKEGGGRRRREKFQQRGGGGPLLLLAYQG